MASLCAELAPSAADISVAYMVLHIPFK